MIVSLRNNTNTYVRGLALLTKRKAFEWIERLYLAPVIVQNVTYQ